MKARNIAKLLLLSFIATNAYAANENLINTTHFPMQVNAVAADNLNITNTYTISSPNIKSSIYNKPSIYNFNALTLSNNAKLIIDGNAQIIATSINFSSGSSIIVNKGNVEINVQNLSGAGAIDNQGDGQVIINYHSNKNSSVILKGKTNNITLRKI